jgi:hypothetical protein
MRILGLFAVAVVSGLVWFYITNDSSTSSSSDGTDTSASQAPAGAFDFAPSDKMSRPDTVKKDCDKHAYGKIKDFLTTTACDHLTRRLYVTKVDGRTIYTSVSVVTMPSEAEAADLRDLTDQDQTGNVSDVVRDKVVTIDGLKTLSADDGYASRQTGADVIIVESAFAPKDKSGDEKADETILDKVSTDGLRLADELDADSGTG